VELYERSVDQERAATDSTDPDPDLTSDSNTNPSKQPVAVVKPDVILMDVNMPVMDGFEATRAIRRFEQAAGCSRATIVAVTGLGDVSAQNEAFASGMDLFLTKPVKLKEVTTILAKLHEAAAAAPP